MYQLKYPVAFHAVDVAITRIHEGRMQVLLAQKTKDEDKKVWRFPGGFIDPWDSCAEEAALREAMEETGMKFGNPITIGYFDAYFGKRRVIIDEMTDILEGKKSDKKVEDLIKKVENIKISEAASKFLTSNIEYLASVKIDDSRYRDTDHKVITSFYEMHPFVQSMEAGEGPFDDIARTKWFFLSDLNDEIINPSHKVLMDIILSKYKTEKIADDVYNAAEEMFAEMENTFDVFKKTTEEIFSEVKKKVPEFEKMAKDTMDKMSARASKIGKSFEKFFNNK